MSATKLPIKPLSTNSLYVGRKVRSKAFRQFEADMATLLAVKRPPAPPADVPLALDIRMGTTRRQDLDNGLKALIDSICNYFSIDDRRIAGLTAVRVTVKPGDEFVTFQFSAFDEANYPDMLVTETA